MNNNKNLMRDYIRRQKASGFTERTIETTTFAISTFIDWCGDRDLQEFTANDVYDWLDHIDEYTFKRKGRKVKYAPMTRHKMRMQVKPFLAFIKPELGAVIKLRMPKEGKIPEDILTKEEIAKLIDACLNNRDRALIATFYESGARKGELLNVLLKHVTFDVNGAIVNIQKGKTGARRIRLVYAASYLQQWIDVHPLKNDLDSFLFCSLNSPFGVISNSGLSVQLRQLAERAGISVTRVYPHAFRHARATHLAECLTEAQLKDYLGWTRSSTMASVYVHLSGRDIDNAILRMNGIDVGDAAKEVLTVGRCPRCKEINPETARFCNKCGLPLQESEKQKIESDAAELNMAIIKAAIMNPAILEEIAKRVNKKE